ncbi:MAG: hypothetical protein IT442_11385 [Phycisphaeraceae bacterium]|nr:hypothetical protein [Phycisphaeraceae bacterium]
MPVTVEERYQSRTVSGDEAQLIYLVRGTLDHAEALAELLAASPTTVGSISRDTSNCQVEELHNGIWLGTARYIRAGVSHSDPPIVGDSSYSFDTGGGTQHITQSLQTIASHVPSGQTAPNFQGAIGATRDGVDGVDITVPVYRFSETHIKADSAVTGTYKGKVYSLTGKVNSGSFRGFNAGECLFLGASGSKRGGASGEDWEITYSFAASPNRTGLTVGSITGIAKKGWEYLWVRYEDVEDTTAKALAKRPTAAYVEKVYELGDFGDLEIGA